MDKPTYTGNLTNIAINRICFDFKNIIKNKDELDKEGIYFNNDILPNYSPSSSSSSSSSSSLSAPSQSSPATSISNKYYNLIVGPADTPYEGGFYLFEAIYPDKYPFYPMTMESITQGGNIRKHPNLYVCGKCCFSFLGTWAGPGWTACQNPHTVALSMRSVLDDNPLTNEPGYTINNGDYHTEYAKIVKYFNLKYAVCDLIEHIPLNFVCFRENIEKNFILNYPKYMISIETFAGLNNTTLTSRCYNMSISIDYNIVKNKLKTIYDRLTINNPPASLPTSVETNKIVKKIIIKRIPKA
jgi:ubiquitin-conjugating enzyme E2 Z